MPEYAPMCVGCVCVPEKNRAGKMDIRRSPGRPFFVSASVVSSFPKPFAMCSAAEQVSAGRVWFVGHGNGEICHNLCDLPGLV
jgi:hypothetical protein